MKSQYRLNKESISVLLFLLIIGCTNAQPGSTLETKITQTEEKKIILGNERLSEYLPQLEGKRIAVVGNHTSVIGSTHLVDSLLNLEIKVVKVFSPEHGFRGTADAGQKVNNELDAKTGLPIISLYGNNKKPTPKQLADVDLILFDIQDVGVRFYTYISTLHYVMEAAAENKKKVIVLDRPNPNGHYIDGPILEKNFKSFVGLHPVPVIHAMTIGEYAQMINGEQWLKGQLNCKLEVISCLNYTHKTAYTLPKAPSPNLPNMKSVYLYPSLCFFEGTPISVGRGTDKPFQQIGHPAMKSFRYFFIPSPNVGAKNPKLNGEKCYGIDFSNQSVPGLRDKRRIDLSYLLNFYDQYPEKEGFFTYFFNLLAGNSKLQAAITDGKSETEIRAGWKKGIETYKATRIKYLLYPD